MTIIARPIVRAAVERALTLDPCMETAIAVAAVALSIPVEAVREVMQPPGWCCERGESLGISICNECAETSAAYSSAMGVVRDKQQESEPA